MSETFQHVKNSLRRWVFAHGIHRRASYLALRKAWRAVRVQYPVTALVGRQNIPSRDKIEIDITYHCNLRCPNCNRSCGQAPSSLAMTTGQIRKFIRETLDTGHRWTLIKVLGGEPTLHPELLEILGLLLDYREQHVPDGVIQIVSNGTGEFVRRMLARIPRGVDIVDTSKGDGTPEMAPFAIAPRDIGCYRFADFSNGCGITTWCGIGLSATGLYPCAPAAGIDRVFGFDAGRRRVPELADDMTDLLRLFCGLCGHFAYHEYGTAAIVSPLWRQSYTRYRDAPPRLTTY